STVQALREANELRIAYGDKVCPGTFDIWLKDYFTDHGDLVSRNTLISEMSFYDVAIRAFLGVPDAIAENGEMYVPDRVRKVVQHRLFDEFIADSRRVLREVRDRATADRVESRLEKAYVRKVDSLLWGERSRL